MEVYSWGSGNYGRLGLGSSADSVKPQLVSGVLNGYEIAAIACSWYHSAVVTSSGDVASFGSKITKCLGTAASGSDASASEQSGDSESEDGNLMRASPNQGKQRLPGKSKDVVYSKGPGRSTGDFVPHLLRSFPSRVNVVQVAVGSDMLGAHTLAISRNGRLYSWGYGPACGLGSTANVSTPTLVTKFLGTGAGESGSGRRRQDMEPLGWGKHSHMRYRQTTSNKNLGLQFLRPRIAKAACGGGFSVVLSSEGEVFTFGVSASGRLGFRTKFRAQLRPRRIETLAEGTTDIAAGAAFVLLCSAAGRLLAWGDNTKGQLGVGHLQESHEPLTLGRTCPSAFVMQAVAAGDSHSLALDSAGRTYSWGGEGGPMTGQGQPVPNSTQVDAAFQFRLRQLSHWWVRPHPIRALSGVHIVHIDAGCLHSLALSQDGALYAWGAPLQAATSRSAGNVQSVRSEVSWVPRLVAPSPKLPLVRVGTAAAGGWHSMATAVPSSGLEKLLPANWFQDDAKTAENAQASQNLLDACDGFLVSEVDSTPEEEVRVPVCCAAIRARLAMPDGTDSPMWRALSAQVVRLRPESVAVFGTEAETTQEDEDSSGSESGGLLEVAEMHRSAQRLSAQRKLPVTARSNDADEAAGLALEPPVSKKVQKKMLPRKKPMANFSSDSDSGDLGGMPSRSDRPGFLARAKERAAPQVAAPKRPVPDFSDESASEEELVPDDVVEAARQSPQSRSDVPSPSRPRPAARPVPSQVPSTLGGLELRNYGEAVLAALVRFLCTDMLTNLTIIDESHPVWQREQQFRMRSPGSSPEGSEDAKRPTRLRAIRGMLLRKEVKDLRHIGTSLGLERLARLCDQLLLRLDAPGAPALFVPASSIGTTMWTLLRQTLRPPDRDGPDTELLCAPPQPHKQRWGPRWLPKDGHLQAHSFVLCAGCTDLQREQRAPDGPAELAGGGRSLGQQSPGVSATSSYRPVLRLQHRNGGGGAPRYELDLRLYTADVVFAWLRYLYTQDDLELTWPLRTDRFEAEAAEKWWMQLLQLGQLIGDWKLQLYAQDTLVGAVSNQNWVEMLSFAEQVKCTVLAEAALMTGLRQLLPHLLASFRVPTGLEGQKGASGQEQPEAAGGVPSHGSVEVELERKFMELRGSKQASHAKAMLLALKKSSPSQFAELKNRLSEAITAAQKSGAQLQRCVEYFDSHEQRGFRREETKGRALRVELAVAVLLLGVFLIPAAARQTIYGAFVTMTEPLTAFAAYVDLWSMLPFTSAVSSIFALNVGVLFLLLVVVFSVLQK